MGQAKRRGTYDERVAFAKQRQKENIEKYELKQQSLDDFIKQNNLPKETKMLGYLVYIADTDEFLAKVIETDYAINRAYTKEPAIAEVYEDIHQAIEQAESIDNYQTAVCTLYDVGDSLMVNGTIDIER